MRRALVMGALFAGALAAPAYAGQPVPEIVAGEFLVHAPGVPRAALDARPDFEVLGELGGGWWLVQAADASRGHDATAEALAADPLIAVAEPNAIVHTTAVPTDPGYPQQWGFDNPADADIDLGAAWDVTRGAGVVVAVIDTGVDVTHPDLAPRLWTNPAEVPGNGLDDDGNGLADDVHGWDFAADDGTVFDSATDDDHGTHVAGVIAATADGAVAGVGVAPEVALMPLKFIGASGSGTTADATQAVNYAVAHGADVINASWAGSQSSTALRDAIAAAGTAGVVFVAAAGNGGTNIDIAPVYPASYSSPNIVAVAASTPSDGVASFSNFGPVSVDVAAPGSGIYSTLPGGGFGAMSGTSMAAPHVSGVVALLRAVHAADSASSLVARLSDGVDPLPAWAGVVLTAGRLNASGALGATPPPPVPGPDTLAGAAPLMLDVAVAGSTVGATLEADEPASCAPIGASHWYRFDGTGATVVVDTVGSGFDTVLDVFTGAPGALAVAACNDDDGGLTSRLTVPTSAGTVYWARIAGYQGASGDYALRAHAVPAATVVFTDIAGSFAAHAISEIAALGITSGCAPGLFCPDAAVTRGDMAIFLQRALHLPGGEPGTFADTAGHYASTAVDAIAAAGITSGRAPGVFDPSGPVSRAEMAVFLVRAYAHAGGLTPASGPAFSDTSGSFAEAQIAILASLGVTAGCGADLYCPQDPVTRAEMAVFLSRLLHLLA